MALALWFHLTTEKIYERTYTAGIEYVGLAADLDIESITPKEADVTFTGTGKQLIKLAVSDDIKLRIDLSAIKKPGQYEHSFSFIDIYPIDPSVYFRIVFPFVNRCNIIVKSKS